VNFVDKTFGPLAPPLIAKFGTDVVFVKVNGQGAYDPATGTVTPSETRIPMKAAIMTVEPELVGGLYETTDIVLYVNPGSIEGSWINIKDRCEIQQGDKTQVAEVFDVKTYRGDKPVLFRVGARPQ